MLADNKGEGFPYSLPSVGLGAHPGVQAIRLLGGGGKSSRRGASQWLVGFNTQYRKSDVAENLGIGVSCMERTVQRFGSEFPASVIIAELWRPEVARPGNCVSNFCVILEKRPLKAYGKIFTVLFKRFNRLSD